MKKFLSILMAAAMMLALIPMAGTAEEPDTNKLVLYTSAGASEYELIVNLFNEKYPDIEVEIVSGGTGEMASRINAEKAAPYGDVMMGGGDTIYRSIADCLEAYRSTEADNLFAEFMPEDNLYTPCYINVNSIIVNKTLIEELGVEVTGWESLCDERLKGKVSFANPADSGSALEVIVNMLAAMNGTGNLEDGWAFVERFLINLDGKFASGSSAAYKSVVEGEYPVGLCNEDKTISYMKDGADVYAVYAKEPRGPRHPQERGKLRARPPDQARRHRAPSRAREGGHRPLRA